jgi:hypothetical protein
MLIKIACIIIIIFGIDAIIYGVIYYRNITKEDREYAKELKDAKKRWKLEEEERLQKLKEEGLILESMPKKNKVKEKIKTKPSWRFRIIIAFPCLLIF